VKHEGHENPEQLLVAQEEIDVDSGQFDEKIGRRFSGAEQVGDSLVELVDVAQEDLCIKSPPCC
jgi:hypothetical protein